MLKGKTALVTGASKGIGKAIAQRLAKDGANIAIIYSEDKQGADSVKNAIINLGVDADIFKCNISDFDEVKQTVDLILKRFGGVDILVNNAGITKDNIIMVQTPEDFNQVIKTNLYGAFYMIKQLYRNFIKRKGGRIINISSVVGITGNKGQANYSAAKAGLIALSKTTAKELAAKNVTCNVIAPGFIETQMTRKLSEEETENIKNRIPLGRFGKAEDIANLTAFLASDEASYITGAVIQADGGLNM